MNANRSEWDIMYDMLNFLGLHRDVTLTQLADAIRLFGNDKKKYLMLLRDKGHVTTDNEDYRTQTRYSCNATAKGLELRDKIKRIYDMFGGKRPIW